MLHLHHYTHNVLKILVKKKKKCFCFFSPMKVNELQSEMKAAPYDYQQVVSRRLNRYKADLKVLNVQITKCVTGDNAYEDCRESDNKLVVSIYIFLF